MLRTPSGRSCRLSTIDDEALGRAFAGARVAGMTPPSTSGYDTRWFRASYFHHAMREHALVVHAPARNSPRERAAAMARAASSRAELDVAPLHDLSVDGRRARRPCRRAASAAARRALSVGACAFSPQRARGGLERLLVRTSGAQWVLRRAAARRRLVKKTLPPELTSRTSRHRPRCTTARRATCSLASGELVRERFHRSRVDWRAGQTRRERDAPLLLDALEILDGVRRAPAWMISTSPCPHISMLGWPTTPARGA